MGEGHRTPVTERQGGSAAGYTAEQGIRETKGRLVKQRRNASGQTWHRRPKQDQARR